MVVRVESAVFPVNDSCHRVNTTAIQINHDIVGSQISMGKDRLGSGRREKAAEELDVVIGRKLGERELPIFETSACNNVIITPLVTSMLILHALHGHTTQRKPVWLFQLPQSSKDIIKLVLNPCFLIACNRRPSLCQRH